MIGMTIGRSTVRGATAIIATGAIAMMAVGVAYAGSLRVIVTHVAPPLVPNSVMDLAEMLGVYEREGVDVEIVRVQQTPSAIAALRSGGGDMANISVSAALQLVARNQMKLKAVVSPNKAIPFMIAARNGVSSAKALEGRTFGVGRIGSLDYSLSRLVLSSMGVDAAKLKMVAIGQPRVRAQALVGGRIDATTMSIGVWSSIKDTSKLKVLVPQVSYFKAAPLLSKVNVVSDETLKTKRGEIEAFVRAIIRLSREFAQEPEKWADAMAKARPEIPRAKLDKLAQAYAESWSVNGGLNLKQVAYTTDRNYRRKDFKDLRRVAPGEWVDTGPIDAVLRQIDTVKDMDETGR